MPILVRVSAAFTVRDSGDTRLVGRDVELARLRGLLAPPYNESRLLLVVGDVGLGKTALLAEAAGRARASGMRILAAVGRESEQDLTFAGLHQLLHPVLDRVADLPARQAEALRGAFAISADPASPDSLLTGIAVLTLLSLLAKDGPVLVLGDDVQWLDRASLDALAFAARRLDAEPAILLLAARGTEPPTRLERDFPEPVRLGPLSAAAAGRLLDAQPRPPRGRARQQVLAQAAGNPLALIELSKVIAADPDAGRRWAAEPLPLASRLTAVMTAQYADLPEATRHALLLAAAADSPDVTALAVPGLAARDLAPAEAAGLIRSGVRGPEFAHPLVRSAVYYAAPLAERAAAHLLIADSLRDQPDRYAWQLAAAALAPDEQVARLLEDTAVQAKRRGGTSAAARALERAAELSPSQRDQARRLLAAADLALPGGQAGWVRELAGKVLTLTADLDQRLAAQFHIGWSLLWSGRSADALQTLTTVVAQAALRRPALAWEAAGLAGTIANQTGLPEARVEARASLAALDAVTADGNTSASRTDEHRIWITACTDPFGGRTEALPMLRRIAGGSIRDPCQVGGAAWLLDETELAVKVLRAALSEMRAPGVGGVSGGVLSALEWACIDSGRWDDALAGAREAIDIAAAYQMDTVAAVSNLAIATVAALRGDHDQVEPMLARVAAAVDLADYPGFAARARHAAALDAIAQGNYISAYAQLSRVFAADGAPLHHRFSYLAIADLAAAAARTERQREASALVERALARVDSAPGPRLAQLAARARGLLAAGADAGVHFAPPLADPAGREWPFERAQLQLDYGEWLRGSGGSTTPSLSLVPPSPTSAAWAPGRGPLARKPNCAPAGLSPRLRRSGTTR